MVVPGVLVHRVEGHATGLHGSRPGGGGGAHDVPWDIKSDALKPCHSGVSVVSTNVLLFSDINLSLAHHCRVFKRGLPHLAFRRDYLACLRVFVSWGNGLGTM